MQHLSELEKPWRDRAASSTISIHLSLPSRSVPDSHLRDTPAPLDVRIPVVEISNCVSSILDMCGNLFVCDMEEVVTIPNVLLGCGMVYIQVNQELAVLPMSIAGDTQPVR